MAKYATSSTLGQQLSNLMSYVISAKQVADRLSGDFAAMETNGGATDLDYDAIKAAMSIADDPTAHALVSLVTAIQGKLGETVGFGGFYSWDPAAN